MVVLDAVSGQVVIPVSQSRSEVMRACQGGDLSIEAMMESWLERTPPETLEILSMLEISCTDDLQNKAKNEGEQKNPYLVSDEPRSVSKAREATTTQYVQTRIKEIFAKLVQEGIDANAAAAQAIKMVASEQRDQVKPKLDPGPWSGKALRAGPAVQEVSPMDLAIAQVIEWNSVDAVKSILSLFSKYLSNVIKEPWNPKFRTFRLSNKVADQITRIQGGLALLESIGLDVYGTSQDYFGLIPSAIDLMEMNEKITRLMTDLE